jgi:ABC-type phosphate transport system permease subunit
MTPWEAFGWLCVILLGWVVLTIMMLSVFIVLDAWVRLRDRRKTQATFGGTWKSSGDKLSNEKWMSE